MDRRNAASRYGQTVYLPTLEGSRATPLHRRRLEARSGVGGYDESWLQRLLFETPEVLPIGEIDPAFAPAVPLCRELPTVAGSIDLAYVSEQGLLSIVEGVLRTDRTNRQALPARLRGFFERCWDDGLEVTLAHASYILHWRRNNGRKVNFGTLFPNGDLNTNYIAGSAEEIGDLEIGENYLEAVAGLVPGATVKKDGKPWTWRVVVGGRKPKIADVLERSDEWLSAIEPAIRAFNSIEED